jgi:Pyridoxamine 5'-phosphate oxidase
MSTFIADRLPDVLIARLSIDRALDHADRAIVICSVDEHGWPHPAMLSSLELVARDARNIRLAPHSASRTARNLIANGRLTIILADEHGTFYIKGDVLLVSSAMHAAPEQAVFNLRVESVLQDNPQDYEEARLTSGIRITRTGPDDERARTVLRELTADPTIIGQ